MAKSESTDLILMDIIMPGINGFRATRIINNDINTARIPIIIMSGDEQSIQEFWVNKLALKTY